MLIKLYSFLIFKGIYLDYEGDCYFNGSYFWDETVNTETEPLSCVLPGTSLTTGEWVRVADPLDPVDCNTNSNSDPFRCTNVTSPNATISIWLTHILSTDQEGLYKCCLPTNCSDPKTNIITANIFSKISNYYDIIYDIYYYRICTDIIILC